MFAATIALAKEANLPAIAVGIETTRQLALARELDCTVGQGFLLHKPAVAGAPAPQAHRRDGNVRAMADHGAAGRRRAAPPERGPDHRRAEAGGRARPPQS